MQAWSRITLLLCTFGFFRELRPSEPFVIEYLSDDSHNLTAEQVNKEIYPLGTYAVLALLAVVFLITDILRYKPVIIVSACSGIILFGILVWANQVWQLQIGQIFYGTFAATEVAYYTYIYAKVDKERYQIVTGHTRSAILCGRFLAGVLGQTLTSFEILDYQGLHYFSFATQIISLVIAITLPSVHKSVYFYTEEDQKKAIELKNATTTTVATISVDVPATVLPQNGSTIPATSNTALPHTHQKQNDIDTLKSPRFSWLNAYQLLLKHIVSAYTNHAVIRWSFWWALATAGQVQIISYIQFLWKDIDVNNQSVYNGGVEAIVTLLGAGSAMLAGYANTSQHKKWHMWILTICSLFMGIFIIVSAWTNSLWMAYIMYILFGIFYFFIITTASAIVAENLSEDSFGLIFGINQLASLVLQAILTLVVVTDTGYGLGPRQQYVVYGGYYIVLAILYLVAVCIRTLHEKLKDCCK